MRLQKRTRRRVALTVQQAQIRHSRRLDFLPTEESEEAQAVVKAHEDDRLVQLDRARDDEAAVVYLCATKFEAT